MKSCLTSITRHPTIDFLTSPGIGLSRPGNDGAAVAWLPLAPDESVEDAHFRNRRAASVVPRAVFAGGLPIEAARLDLPGWRLDDAPAITGAPDIAPVGAAGTGLTHVAPTEPVALAGVVTVPHDRLPPRPMPFARVREVRAHAALRKLPHRWRTAALVSTRPHLTASTAATHSTHNRAHLAAARGGAQLR